LNSNLTPALLCGKYIERYHFAGFALDGHFEGATAGFAIGREPLIANGGVEFQIKTTGAKRALDLFGELHRGQG
jgi:hypothetical protein